jgi:hypothetical protein
MVLNNRSQNLVQDRTQSGGDDPTFSTAALRSLRGGELASPPP